MPSNHGLRLHDGDHVTPTRPVSIEGDPEKTVDVRQARPFHMPLGDSELLAERQVLERQAAAGSQERCESAKQGDEEVQHAGA